MAGMRIGINTDVLAGSAPITDLARAVEAAGLESLFVTQRTHLPGSRLELREDPFHRDDGDLFDPFLALAAAAAVTSRIRLGTGICQVPLYDPIMLAKQVVTVDHLSGGRFLFGVGPGWLEEEIRNHGLEPALRWKAMRETLLALKQIWSSEEASFAGDVVHFDRVRLGPKPLQQPHPPILIGRTGVSGPSMAVELGDGWFPIISDVVQLESDLARLDRLCRESGRPPVPTTLALFDIDESFVERSYELGVSRCTFWWPPGSLQDGAALLGRLAALAKRYRA